MAADDDGWTPLFALADLTNHPARVEIAGTPLVAWRGPWGRPIVFVDRCPHRDVPLSHGRRTFGGRLVCDGHGWVFDPTGACVAIPGRPTSDARGRRASVVPSRVADGRIWVRWPDTAAG